MPRYANRNKRPDFQSGHRKMCAGSSPVRGTNGNDVTQVVTLVCKTRAFGRCEFESRQFHNKRERQSWRVGPDCKSGVSAEWVRIPPLSQRIKNKVRILKIVSYLCKRIKWPVSLSVRTPGFHPGKTSSILVRATNNKKLKKGVKTFNIYII